MLLVAKLWSNVVAGVKSTHDTTCSASHAISGASTAESSVICNISEFSTAKSRSGSNSPAQTYTKHIPSQQISRRSAPCVLPSSNRSDFKGGEINDGSLTSSAGFEVKFSAPVFDEETDESINTIKYTPCDGDDLTHFSSRSYADICKNLGEFNSVVTDKHFTNLQINEISPMQINDNQHYQRSASDDKTRIILDTKVNYRRFHSDSQFNNTNRNFSDKDRNNEENYQSRGESYRSQRENHQSRREGHYGHEQSNRSPEKCYQNFGGVYQSYSKGSRGRRELFRGHGRNYWNHGNGNRGHYHDKGFKERGGKNVNPEPHNRYFKPSNCVLDYEENKIQWT